MNKKEEAGSVGRRDFLRKAGLGAGTAGAVAVGLSAASAQAKTPEAGASGAGYQETDHVKKFYELAKF